MGWTVGLAFADSPNGVIVATVAPSSPAATAGARPTDRLVAIESFATGLTAARANAILAEHESDFSIAIEVERAGARIPLRVVLTRNLPPPQPPMALQPSGAWWGSTLENRNGMAFVHASCTPALVSNDRILSVAGKKTATFADAEASLAAQDATKSVTLELERASTVVASRIDPQAIATEAFRDARIGKPAPEWHDPVSIWGSIPDWLAQLKDSTVVLAFWSSTCEACLPFAERLAAVQGSHSKQMRTFAVTSESAKAASRDTRFPRSYPFVSDSTGVITQAYATKDTPTIVVIDRRGNIAAVATLARMTPERVTCAIERVLSRP